MGQVLRFYLDCVELGLRLSFAYESPRTLGRLKYVPDLTMMARAGHNAKRSHWFSLSFFIYYKDLKLKKRTVIGRELEHSIFLDK